MYDELEIPDFLKRPMPPKEEWEKIRAEFLGEKPITLTVKKLTPAEERERDINRIAKKRWQQWRAGDVINGNTTLQRPRESTYRKIVDAEWKAKGW